MSTLFSAQPVNQGLYNSGLEHDACGVAFIATMRGRAGHDIMDHAMTALRNLEHRGATGADPLVGDGAGILTQIPDALYRALGAAELAQLVRPGGLVADVKGIWRDVDLTDDRRRWEL